MADFCKYCKQLEIDGDCQYGNEYYCKITHKYTPENREACEHFVKREEGGYRRAGFSFWYIVTKVCKLLNISLESEFYKNLFSLRNYFEETEKGLEFLNEYDVIGPVLSAKIANEGTDFAQVVLDSILVPCEKLIKTGNLEEAAILYQEMVGVLKVRYKMVKFKLEFADPRLTGGTILSRKSHQKSEC